MRAASLIGLSTLFVALWSSGWVASRFAVNDVSAIALLTTRYLLLFLVLLVVVTVAGHWRHLSRSDIICHFFVGILTHAIYLLSGISAFEMGVSAGLVAFVTALHPMITAFLSAPITRERITVRQWQGLLIGFLAVLLLVSESYRLGVSALALALPFISVVALSIGSLINRRIELQGQRLKRRPTPVTLILFIHSVGALCLLIPLSLSAEQLQFDYNMSQWFVLLWLAIVVSLGAYAVILILLRHMSAMRVSSLSFLVPPATMMQAYLVFEDSITANDLAGLIVAAVGAYFVMIPKSDSSIKVHRQVIDEVSTNQLESRQTIRLTQPNRLLVTAMALGRATDIEL